jgi:N-acyl-D-amino-acid deacylase
VGLRGYPEYLGSLERRGLVPNVASFVGHSSVRTYVLGEEASQRKATDAEIAEMRRIVLEALRAGAIGFATSTLAGCGKTGFDPLHGGTDPSKIEDFGNSGSPEW